MLLDGSLDPRSSRHALEVIDRNAQLQAQLVADILDVSRIITGGLRLDTRPVDLGSVIGAALDAVRPAAAAKDVRLTSRFADSPRLVHGDPQRLQQVVWNLLSNAVKFTDSGGTVTVELRQVETRRVQVRVTDDGARNRAGFSPSRVRAVPSGGCVRKPSARRARARARDRPASRRAARRNGARRERRPGKRLLVRGRAAVDCHRRASADLRDGAVRRCRQQLGGPYMAP